MRRFFKINPCLAIFLFAIVTNAFADNNNFLSGVIQTQATKSFSSNTAGMASIEDDSRVVTTRY